MFGGEMYKMLTSLLMRQEMGTHKSVPVAFEIWRGSRLQAMI